MTYFFEHLERYSNNIACIDGDESLTYAQLQEKVARRKNEINSAIACQPNSQGSNKAVIAIVATNSNATLINYLAGLQLRHVVLFLNATTSGSETRTENGKENEKEKENRTNNEIDNESIKQFLPLLVLQEKHLVSLPQKRLSTQGEDVSSAKRADIQDDVALLLSTSGSTGDSKQVVLSYTNLQSNCSAICAYLPIIASDVSISTLPFNYSYGLSIINTHLASGAGIVFTRFSVMQREFWECFKRHSVTSFGGVPHSYDMLFRLKFTQMVLPSLRYFTQAGGRLGSKKIEALAQFAKHHGRAFFVMYGQTEATARMSFVTHDVLLSKADTIGKAIPGSEISIIDNNGLPITQAQQEGELVFRGESVMLGYAECKSDLVDFPARTSLRTGDIGYFDDDGDLFISGRIKRIVKLSGERISLDQVEALLSKTILFEFAKEGKVAVIGSDKRLTIILQFPTHLSGKSKALGLADNVTKNVTENVTENATDTPAEGSIEITEWFKQLEQGIKKSLQSNARIHPSAVKIIRTNEIPSTNSGKTDYKALHKEFLLEAS